MNNIQNLEILLEKYYYALETANFKKQKKIYEKYLLSKREIKSNIDLLSKKDKNKLKIISSEFRILSNEEERNKLFYGIKKTQANTNNFTTNDDYIKESKQLSSNTTSTLRKSLQELEESKQIADECMVQINIDNDKLNNINENVDQTQSDGKIAIKIITQSLKRLYTDKLIILFTFIIVSLIAIILLFKYKIIV